ncbi:MAG: hypothetical protein LBK47_06880 [Prevotellaceae bacterium]|jgi:hypothetical protein|nr:hypothetical protein [Prevotellaceae bacterium]
MAQFSAIISSILRDFTAAQHEANLCSLALAQAYRKNGKAKDFRLPNAIIEDIELDIKYAITDTSVNQEQYEVDQTKLRNFFKDISLQLSKIIITAVVSSVATSAIPSGSKKKKFQELMNNESKLRKDFAEFMGKKIRTALTEKQSELLEENGSINTDELLNAAMEVAQAEFLTHRDLDTLFEDERGEELREEAAENAKIMAEGLVEKTTKDFNVARKKVYPSLDVVVAADELQKLPEDAIHSIRFKIQPKYYSVVDAEQEGNSSFKIVAQ